MYSVHIIQASTISNYSAKNQRDLILDTVENLRQIGEWSRKSFVQEQKSIALYLALTRKNLNALESFPLSEAFLPEFRKFAESYASLEKEFKTGIKNTENWATGILRWSETLTKHAALL